MSNSQYKIKGGNLNMAGGSVSNSQYKLNESLGQISPGFYSGTNYKVKAGFQYFKKTSITFSFAISNTSIDFGVITPTNPLTRTTALTVSSQSGFSVTASEDKPLTSKTGGVIPDTSCDSGGCNTTSAAAWTSAFSFGFGYRCDPSAGSGQANTCSSDFANDSFYKPFVATPSAQTIMTAATGGTNKKSQITYKVNVSGTQPQGIYSNIVTYIANPGY